MKVYVALLFFVVLASCCSKNQYEIIGSFNGKTDDEWVYIVNYSNDENTLDSAKVINGKFRFKGQGEFYEPYFLYNQSDKNAQHFMVFIEPTKIKIELNTENWAERSIINGGTINMQRQLLKEKYEKQVAENLRGLSKCSFNEQLTKSGQMKRKNRQYSMDLKLDYIQNNPQSPLSLYYCIQLYNTGDSIVNNDSLTKIINNFPSNIKYTSTYSFFMDVKNKIDKKKNSERCYNCYQKHL